MFTTIKVLISGREEPEAEISPAMDAAIRVFKRVNGISDGEDGAPSAPAGAAVCSVRFLVASSQAISLIGKGGVQIKSIQEGSGATIRVLSGGTTPTTTTTKLGQFHFLLKWRTYDLQFYLSKMMGWLTITRIEFKIHAFFFLLILTGKVNLFSTCLFISRGVKEFSNSNHIQNS